MLRVRFPLSDTFLIAPVGKGNFLISFRGKNKIQTPKRRKRQISEARRSFTVFSINIASFRFKVYLGPGESPMPADEGADVETQQMDAKEVANLLRKAAAAKEGNPPHKPVQPNKLPDVYPEDKNNKL